MSRMHIVLWIEAPLQSWGADSKFGRRDTLPFPTKSGVLGMLLCAMGKSGPQQDLLQKLTAGALHVASYVRSTPGKDGQARTKVAREPLLRDFHMVGSGYEASNSWQNLCVPKTSEGKKAVGGGTKMTYRYYLQDARFAVILEVPEDMADIVANALDKPVYDIYFGRKNCVPTERVYRGSFSSLAAAWQKAGEIAQAKQLLEDFRVLEGEHEGDRITLNDVPLQFGEIKKYRDRRVTVVPA